MDINLQKMTNDEFTVHLRAVLAEQERRRAQPHIDQAEAHIVQELQDAGKLPLPDALTDEESLPEDQEDIPAWSNPGTDHSQMYRQGDIITYQGRVWRSEHPFLNHWEPGTTGIDDRIWRDITPTAEPDPEPAADEPPADEQPTDDEEPPTEEDPTADAPTPQPAEYADTRSYKAGDTVTYNGSHYVAQQAHFAAPGWTPLNAHMMWKRTEPAAG